MPTRTSTSGSELFIVDNSDTDWKVVRYLHDWCQISKAIDIATGYFEIGALLALGEEWQKVDQIRLLIGDEVSLRTKRAFEQGLTQVGHRLDDSLEREKERNDFLAGVPAIVEGIRSGRIVCRVYRKDKFHAKAYITHARLEVVGSSALVGSSNFTVPGLTENVELNVQITGRPVAVLQEWFEEHWNEAEDVTPEILRVVERQVAPYTPFEVYARSLQEYFRGHEQTTSEWELLTSRMFGKIDKYQQDGYQNLMKIADRFGGAFLCDGVGLGKTFVGLMLIERYVVKERKNVLLLAPKGAKTAVWEPAIRQYLSHIRGGDFSNLAVLSHTDLNRGGTYPERLEAIREKAHVIIIDEAHHFRNPGTRGGPLLAEWEDTLTDPGKIPAAGQTKPSRYWRLHEIAEGKTLFFLTATPINNRLDDLRHVIELFSREKADYFASTLGIHSLVGHFRQLEKDLERTVESQSRNAETAETNLEEAQVVLTKSPVFNALVVQRSRAYVKRSQELTGVRLALFPIREDPKVADYSIAKTFGRLLAKLERAFDKEKPLFALPVYYPLAYYRGKEPKDVFQEGRQRQVVALIRTQFLKRFESSAHAFEASCERLFLKLLAFVTKYAQSPAEKRRLSRWLDQHEAITERLHRHQIEAAGTELDEDEVEDLISPEMLEDVQDLSEADYDIDQILDETYLDLQQLSEFLEELESFEAAKDDKLRVLVKLLKNDRVLSNHKVLIFSEFADTARYLRDQLVRAGLAGVEEIDGGTKEDRATLICRFAPYYNGSSSGELARSGNKEIRILVSTDVLAEGLNLQDATRLINFDLHWNPVRLMQRIGRIDRRMNPDIEDGILADHPDQRPLRGHVAYWNFLPPKELDLLLKLYRRVAHKTLKISQTFGIEGKKLLRPEDDYQALQEFNAAYEGSPSRAEEMHLEYQALLTKYPGLEDRLASLPKRVFSGKAHPQPGSRALFFCYGLPASSGVRESESWSVDAGPVEWYLFDLAAQQVLPPVPIMTDTTSLVRLV
jgi:superfamily II DNA or RNA helicase